MEITTAMVETVIMKKVIIVLMITWNIWNHKTGWFIQLILLKKIFLLQRIVTLS